MNNSPQVSIINTCFPKEQRTLPEFTPVLHSKFYTPCFEKLNKRKWPYSFSKIAYGMHFGVRTDNPALLEKLQEHLPGGCCSGKHFPVDRMFSLIGGGKRGNTKYYNLLYANHSLVARSFDLEEILARFKDLVELSIAELSRRKLFLHAGVVGWKDKAVILPGKSLSGKSTLVRELVRQGASYFSDEYAVIDHRGYVYPHSKPLTSRNLNEHQQTEVAMETLSGIIAEKPLPVRLVIASQYVPQGRWKPKLLSQGQGILLLLKNTFSTRNSPERDIRFLQNILNSADMIKTSRGEAEITTNKILQLLESDISEKQIRF